MQSSLKRDAILQAEDLPREWVEIPEWQGGVYVTTLVGTDRDAFEQTMLRLRTEDGQVSLANIRARLAVLCAVDEAGNRLFGDQDAGALGRKSARALDRIFGVAQRLNGMTKADVEELAKN